MSWIDALRILSYDGAAGRLAEDVHADGGAKGDAFGFDPLLHFAVDTFQV